MKNSLPFYGILIVAFFISTTMIAQDWPNLQRFQKANSELGAPGPSENRIVFMGNSITEGWSNHRPEFFKGKPYVNRGISGQTTPQMLIRFKQDVVDLHPKVVVILAGINDIAGNTGPSTVKMIQDNIASMAEIAAANNIKVVLCSTLPAYDFPWRPGMKPAQKVVQLNSFLKLYSKNNGHVYVDYFSAVADDRPGLRPDLGSDGVHPNAKGYAIMEPLVEAGIREAMD